MYISNQSIYLVTPNYAVGRGTRFLFPSSVIPFVVIKYVIFIGHSVNMFFDVFGFFRSSQFIIQTFQYVSPRHFFQQSV